MKPVRACLLGLCLVAGARTAPAQEVLPAYRQLFQPTMAAAPRHHQLYFAGSVFTGRTLADFHDSSGLIDQRVYDTVYLGAAPRLEYVYTGEHATVRAITSASFWRYSSGYLATRYFEHLRITTPLTPHTDLSFRGMISYSPLYVLSFAVDPAQEETDLVPEDDPHDVVLRRNLDVDVTGEWRYRFAPRTELAMEGGIADTSFFGTGVDVLSPHGQIRLSHRFTPNARLQVGYGYREWRYDSGRVLDTTLHQILSGVHYTRRLNARGTTRIGFNAGSAVAQTPLRAQFDVNGDAFLSHQISPTWTVVGSYHRGLEVRAGLTEPLFLFGDNIAGTIGGLLSRRIALRSTGSYVRGRSMLDPFQQHSSWWTGTTVLSVRVARGLAAFGQGTVTSQRFAVQVGPLLGLPNAIDRYSINAGLTVAFPLLR